MSTINIALTSYPKRITNCVAVINSVLENTVLPDRVYLTLSHLEFPKYEQDLPQDLYKLVMTSNKVILNWVEDNTKSFKKVFPVLKYLEDDDIIIPIDDDTLVPKDFIESRYADFKNNGEKHPITSNHSKSVNLDNLIVQCYSLFQKKMLANWEEYVTDAVVNTHNDDRTYLYLCHMNGYILVPCSKYSLGKAVPGVQPLQVAPHGDYKYDIGTAYDNAVRKVVMQLSNGREIGECFGLFNEEDRVQNKKSRLDKKAENDAKKLLVVNTNPIGQTPEISPDISKMFQYGLKTQVKHDVVYVLGKGSKFNNLEIKISIMSLLKFCDIWLGNIYIVGENPGIGNPRVKHIYAPDITRVNKDANIIHKLLTAIWKIPSLSDNFLFCSDDILVTRESSWEDFAPRYVFEYPPVEKARQLLYAEAKNNTWDMLMLNTLDRFIGNREHIYFYEPHIFAPINKRYFKQMCNQIDYTNNRNVIVMSLWFNWLNLKNPQKRFDHQSVFSANIPNLKNVQRHLTYNDKAFEVKKFRDWLINLVMFEQK